ncbi:hypothetical protein Plim_2771 [Planctopirus limnophila DSM 3776]|uniref:Uncharacterized protein n=1 Tax=Planctopirus limnophila (strain ATCC 43296 / DSM 3776 / IFAM 1008 / Mu 290) TaxID=521674 RepID=D5SRA1_PLAL2|nr:hypothetical protein [Planctopirus limnophila]ADG68594.1 hypothetical protein Plim_2771 [Planctopirus limnophila DSM 3776]
MFQKPSNQDALNPRQRVWGAAWLVCFGCLILPVGCNTTGGPRLVWNKPEKQPSNEKSVTSAKTDPVEKKSSSPVKIVDPEKLLAKADGPLEAKTDPAESPFQASRSQKVTTSAAPEMPIEPAPSAQHSVAKNVDAGSSSATGAGGMSPATLKLIDQELAGANAEERAYWYDQLKKVDPAVVPQILQARRMSLQLTARQSEANPPGNPPWADGVASAQGSGLPQGSAPAWGHSTNTQKPQAANSGMGNASPWANSETENGAGTRGGPDDLQRSRRSAIQLAQHRDLEAHQPASGMGVEQARHEVAAGTKERAQSAFYRVDQTSSDQTSGTSGPIQPQSYQESVTNQTASRNTSAPAAHATLGPAGKFGVVQSPVTRVSATGSSSVGSSQPGFSSAGGDSLDQLISQTEASVNLLTRGESPESRDYYLRQHVYLRLLYLMADRPERAMAAIPGISASEQEFWQQMLWGLSNYFDSKQIPQTADRASQAVAQFQAGVSKLKQMARLELRNVCFCKQIWYFGNYEKFPRDEFRPGQEVLVYAEAENFQSELTPEGQYRTLLRSKIDIISPAGEIRHQIEFPPTEDLCRNERRDYFHNYQFTIPEKMPLGPHSLKLTVHDELSGRVTSSSINFVVK